MQSVPRMRTGGRGFKSWYAYGKKQIEAELWNIMSEKELLRWPHVSFLSEISSASVGIGSSFSFHHSTSDDERH